MALVLSSSVLLCDRFVLDWNRGRLFDRESGAAVPIGSRALAVLGVLIEEPDNLVSKGEIMDAVWPRIAVEESNLTVQISALRRILDAGKADSSCIQTIPGRGYRFIGSVTPAELPPAPAAPASPAPDLAIRDDAEARSPIGDSISPRSHSATLVSTPMSRWPPLRRRIAIMAANSLAILVAAVLLLTGAKPALFRTSESPTAGADVAPPSLSIVVLPFSDLSASRDQQYFVDALTEDLTADLSRLSGAFVISSNTAFTYRDRPVDTRKIGRELGVRYVVDGSIRRAGEQVRATVQLIDAETDAHLWAERFDSEHGDLLTLQNAITARIGNTLHVELIQAAAARPLADRSDVNDLILRGRAASFRGPSRANHAEAIGFFERALALDTNSWEAQARLATQLIDRNGDGFIDTEATDIARAKELIEQVRVAAPREMLVRYATGQLLCYQGRYEEAITEYEAVLAINPNWPHVISHIGRCKYRLRSMAETISLQEQAIRLSPRDPFIFLFYFRIGEAHLLQGHIDEAISWLEKARGANPTVPFVHFWLASAYGLQGRQESAAEELAEARRLIDDESYSSIVQFARTQIRREPKLQPLYEVTLYAGLRAAGMAED